MWGSQQRERRRERARRERKGAEGRVAGCQVCVRMGGLRVLSVCLSVWGWAIPCVLIDVADGRRPRTTKSHSTVVLSSSSSASTAWSQRHRRERRRGVGGNALDCHAARARHAGAPAVGGGGVQTRLECWEGIVGGMGRWGESRRGVGGGAGQSQTHLPLHSLHPHQPSPLVPTPPSPLHSLTRGCAAA